MPMDAVFAFCLLAICFTTVDGSSHKTIKVNSLIEALIKYSKNIWELRQSSEVGDELTFAFYVLAAIDIATKN